MGGFLGLKSFGIKLLFFFWSCQPILIVGLGGNREAEGYFELLVVVVKCAKGLSGRGE